jgi:hypothetical protein
MSKTLIIIILTLCSTGFSRAYGQLGLNPDSLGAITQAKINLGEGPMVDYIIVQRDTTIRESKRVVAILLCITLGPFGMHRLYLGTEPQVAAAYSVTLGGGFGFVTVVDLLYLVFSRDISRFRNNPNFIMWRKP